MGNESQAAIAFRELLLKAEALANGLGENSPLRQAMSFELEELSQRVWPQPARPRTEPQVSEAELRRRQAEGGGRPTAEILADLEKMA